MARKMNARTEGLRNFVEMALNKVREGNVAEAESLLVDLWNDVGGAYVCKMDKLKQMSPVPKYNAKRDGDYSSWLVANNCD